MNALNLMDREQYLVARRQQLLERKEQYEIKLADIKSEIKEKQGKITSKELANLRYKEILFQDELNCIYNKLGIEVEEPVKEEVQEEVVEAEQEPVEEWRDIEGYENLYQVSSFGRVRSLRRCQIVKPRKDYNSEMWGLYLHKNGEKTWHTIQYLVLKTYVGNPGNDKRYMMLHLDGNIDNNRLDNLMWADELNDIPVYCITTKKAYKSAMIANEIDGYTPKAIIRSCHDPRLFTGRLDNGTGCKWKFMPKKLFDKYAKRHKVIDLEEFRSSKNNK